MVSFLLVGEWSSILSSGVAQAPMPRELADSEQTIDQHSKLQSLRFVFLGGPSSENTPRSILTRGYGKDMFKSGGVNQL